MTYDLTIIGAGIVGLGCALKTMESRPGLRVLILEKEAAIGEHQTGRNSGVIHSGIYYRPGSLKAKNCIKGYGELLRFCRDNEIDHEICGKVIVATREEELPALQRLYSRGVENGLTGLRELSGPQIEEIEPHVRGIRGIFVPQTGIIDFKAVAARYAAMVQEMGAELKLASSVSEIRRGAAVHTVVTQTGESFATRSLVSCAGLFSDRVARMTFPGLPVRIIPFRGEYYLLNREKRGLVKSLIYPVPDPAFPFLGVHFTRMIDGEVEAGPNAVLAFKREGYKKSDISLKDTCETFAWGGFRKVARKYWKAGAGEFHRSLSKKAFVEALQRLVPDIREGDLTPGQAGVRAQACDRDGRLLDDFYIHAEDNIIHVCNAPSPAATSSLAIGETVSEQVLASL